MNPQSITHAIEPAVDSKRGQISYLRIKNQWLSVLTVREDPVLSQTKSRNSLEAMNDCWGT